MKYFKGTCFIILLGLITSISLFADVSISTQVETDTVFTGQSFLYQLLVENGSLSVEPDFSLLKGVGVENLGVQSQSYESITTVNGKRTRIVKSTNVYSYRLTPLSDDSFIIPAFLVTAEGEPFRTAQISITVHEPEVSDNYHLIFSVSKDNVYAGESFILTCTWYFGNSVKMPSLFIPVFNDDNFQISDIDIDPDPAKEYYSVPVNNGETAAYKGAERYNGKDYAFLRMLKKITPVNSGNFDIGSATASFEGVSGSQNSRDLFNRIVKQDIYSRYTIPSNNIRVVVKDLPVDGRPENFTGIIGEFLIEASAAPLEVHVGDPITLTLSVSSSDIENLELGKIKNIPDLLSNFRIPDQQAPGRITGDTKRFTQTIRVLDDTVTEIPALRFSYFNTTTGTYEYAVTTSIPLNVLPTRIVTADDLEGAAAGDNTALQTEKKIEGILFNYTGIELLDDAGSKFSVIKSPLYILTLVIPLLLFIIVFLYTYFRTNPVSSGKHKGRNAYSVFVKTITNTDITFTLNQYFSSRFNCDNLLFDEFFIKAVKAGVDKGLLQRLTPIIKQLEQNKYGTAELSDNERNDIICELTEILEEIEGVLG